MEFPFVIFPVKAVIKWWAVDTDSILLASHSDSSVIPQDECSNDMASLATFQSHADIANLVPKELMDGPSFSPEIAGWEGN